MVWLWGLHMPIKKYNTKCSKKKIINHVKLSDSCKSEDKLERFFLFWFVGYYFFTVFFFKWAGDNERQSAGTVTAEVCNGKQYRDALLLKKMHGSIKAVSAEQQWGKKQLNPKRRGKKRFSFYCYSWFEVVLYSSGVNKLLENSIMSSSMEDYPRWNKTKEAPPPICI